MSPWTSGERISHYVSVCGRVTDAKRNPLSGIQLDIRRAAERPVSRVKDSDGEPAPAKAGSQAGKTLRQTESSADGLFFFLDCPSGRYVITAVDRKSGTRAEQTISVQEDARKKKVKDRGAEEGYRIELVMQQSQQ
jgi:hypothetical protein